MSRSTSPGGRDGGPSNLSPSSGLYGLDSVGACATCGQPGKPVDGAGALRLCWDCRNEIHKHPLLDVKPVLTALDEVPADRGIESMSAAVIDVLRANHVGCILSKTNRGITLVHCGSREQFETANELVGWRSDTSVRYNERLPKRLEGRMVQITDYRR